MAHKRRRVKEVFINIKVSDEEFMKKNGIVLEEDRSKFIITGFDNISGNLDITLVLDKMMTFKKVNPIIEGQISNESDL